MYRSIPDLTNRLFDYNTFFPSSHQTHEFWKVGLTHTHTLIFNCTFLHSHCRFCPPLFFNAATNCYCHIPTTQLTLYKLYTGQCCSVYTTVFLHCLLSYTVCTHALCETLFIYFVLSSILFYVAVCPYLTPVSWRNVVMLVYCTSFMYRLNENKSFLTWLEQ